MLGGVVVISNTKTEGEGNTLPVGVQKGAKMMSIDNMVTYGFDGKKATAKIKRQYINPDGSIIMEGETYEYK